MSESLEKLRQIVTTSSLSLSDQNDLLVFLPILPDQALADLGGLFEKNSKLLKEFNENFKARLKVLINGRDSWDKLIEQEEEILEKSNQEEEEEEEEEEGDIDSKEG